MKARDLTASAHKVRGFESHARGAWAKFPPSAFHSLFTSDTHGTDDPGKG